MFWFVFKEVCAKTGSLIIVLVVLLILLKGVRDLFSENIESVSLNDRLV